MLAVWDIFDLQYICFLLFCIVIHPIYNACCSYVHISSAFNSLGLPHIILYHSSQGDEAIYPMIPYVSYILPQGGHCTCSMHTFGCFHAAAIDPWGTYINDCMRLGTGTVWDFFLCKLESDVILYCIRLGVIA